MVPMVEGADGLVSLVYISSSTRPLSDGEILEILRTSQKNNIGRDVTGLLLYKDGNFMQALEGKPATLKALMETVERDNRHRGVIVLRQKPIEERQFPNWSMAFKNISGVSGEDTAFSPFLSSSFLDEEFQRQPDLSYKLLLHFKGNIR